MIFRVVLTLNLRLQRYYPSYVHRPNDRLHVYQIVEHVRTHTKYIDHMDTVKQHLK